MKISFYNRDGRWYADLPLYIEAGGTEEECEMVMGADDMLETLSRGKDRLVISIHLEGTERLDRLDYLGEGYYGWDKEDKYQVIWLCPVTLFVFGEYPDKINFDVI